MPYILIGLGVALLAFIAVLIVRTILFTPKAGPIVDETPVEFDHDAAVSNLQELIRCKTVSSYNHEEEDEAEFQKLIAKLPSLYPHVFETCSFDQLPDRGLLFKWKGRDEHEPAVMMAHYDVVPVNEDAWEKPPFEAIIEDGVLWGRGALDTKVTFNGVLTAADTLISQGFVPAHDMYFAFSGGEEVNGLGAIHIVDWFQEHHITPGMVVDEGGAVVQDVFPGVTQPCGLIGIAEKGFMNAKFTCKSAGGHASAPKPHTPVGVLSAACTRIENHPTKFQITKPVAEMFDTLGRHSSFAMRMIFANLWCFKGILNGMCKKSGGEMNALLRTTVAFTQMEGSSAPNVIPPEASMIANLRLNPNDSIASTLAYLKKTVNDPNVEISDAFSEEPSIVSRTDVEGWQRISSAVASTWKGCLVAPYLMVQCSDSRHYSKISDRVYRFSAMDLTKEERGTIHGNNERIRLDTLCHAVEFYIRLMKQC